MGTRLRKLKSDMKGKVSSDKKKTYDTFQNYYEVQSKTILRVFKP